MGIIEHVTRIPDDDPERELRDSGSAAAATVT
jgi:hypothetical protein